MTTPVFIGLGLLLTVILVGVLAYLKALKRKGVENRWQEAYADKLACAHLKAEIAKLKRQKKRFSHLEAELQAIMNRRLLWEQGA